LTSAPVTVLDELREHVRGVTPWFDDPAEWRATVRRVFDVPEEPAVPGWEPLRRAHGTAPDLDAWAALRMPDVWVLPHDVMRCGRRGSRSG
jgi:hypothetical protein